MKAYLKFKDSDERLELPFTGAPAEMHACTN